MSKDVELRIEAPRVTGVVRFELYGDEKLAKSYMQLGRKLLGTMKQIHGVNSNTEVSGGGYFFRETTLEDGTKVKVITNDGQDIIRIDAPVTYDYQSESEKEIILPNKSFTPFIWVGAKCVKGGVMPTAEPNWDANQKLTYLHLCVWEPSSGTEDEFNIVSNRKMFTALFEGTPEGSSFGMYGPGTFDTSVKSAIYPLGPSSSDQLEVWENSEYSDVMDGEYPATASHMIDGKAHKYTEYEVIIRSTRTEQGLDVLDTSGAGSVIPVEGRYIVKAVMFVYVEGYIVYPSEYEIRLVVGTDDSDGRIDKTVKVIFEKFTDRMSDIMPKGWHPFLKPVNYADAEECLATWYGIDDHGPAVHEPWWQSGFDVSMPGKQVMVPEDQFKPPVLEMPDTLLPPEGFENEYNAARSIMPPNWRDGNWLNVPPIDFAAPRIWLPRSYRSPAAGTGNNTRYLRLILFTTTLNGSIVFAGSQIKRTDPACSPDTPVPTLLSIFRDVPVYGAGMWAGTYTAMDSSELDRTITLQPAESPGGGVNIWNNMSCFGGTGYTIFDGSTTGSPPGVTTRLYARYVISVEGNQVSNGPDYGYGQTPTEWSDAETYIETGESDFLANGGLAGWVCYQTDSLYGGNCQREKEIY